MSECELPGMISSHVAHEAGELRQYPQGNHPHKTTTHIHPKSILFCSLFGVVHGCNLVKSLVKHVCLLTSRGLGYWIICKAPTLVVNARTDPSF